MNSEQSVLAGAKASDSIEDLSKSTYSHKCKAEDELFDIWGPLVENNALI